MNAKRTRIMKKRIVNQASVVVTTPTVFTVRQMKSQRYAKIEKRAVVANTPVSLIFFGSSTATTATALITKRLKAADPTIVDAPSGPAGLPRVPRASITERRISGADDPRAMRVRLAIVAFQTWTCC